MRTIRVTIPDQDEDAKAWLAAQCNRAASLRFLMHREMAERGPVDALCFSSNASRPKPSSRPVPKAPAEAKGTGPEPVPHPEPRPSRPVPIDPVQASEEQMADFSDPASFLNPTR